jgi:hypothetical protein
VIRYDKNFHAKVLINETGYRMVLLSMRAGQHVPEYATDGVVPENLSY